MRPCSSSVTSAVLLCPLANLIHIKQHTGKYCTIFFKDPAGAGAAIKKWLWLSATTYQKIGSGSEATSKLATPGGSGSATPFFSRKKHIEISLNLRGNNSLPLFSIRSHLLKTKTKPIVSIPVLKELCDRWHFYFKVLSLNRPSTTRFLDRSNSGNRYRTVQVPVNTTHETLKKMNEENEWRKKT